MLSCEKFTVSQLIRSNITTDFLNLQLMLAKKLNSKYVKKKKNVLGYPTVLFKNVLFGYLLFIFFNLVGK